MQHIVPFLLVASMLLLGSCGAKKKKKTADADYKEKPVFGIDSLVDESDAYIINIRFPVIQPDALYQPLSEKIMAYVDKAVEPYKGDSLQNLLDEFGSEGKYETIIDFAYWRNDSDYVSLELSHYTYELGAHGYTFHVPYTYSLEEREIMKLEDFVDLSDSTKARKVEFLMAEYLDNPDSCFTEKPTLKFNEGKFLLSLKGVVFIFNAYDLGAYICGPAHIEVPYEALRKEGLLKLDPEPVPPAS